MAEYGLKGTLSGSLIPGPKGEKGDKGDTYVLTSADKEEIAHIVLEELPDAESEEF